MKACVVGGGNWGSAFAFHLGQKHIPTRLWIREKEVYEQTLRYRENKTFLPGTVFPPEVSFHHDLGEAVNDAEIVFIAVPSKFCRRIYEHLRPQLGHEPLLVSLTKGIEEKTLLRMSEIMEDVFQPKFTPRVAVVSGPSFAREVADFHPTVVVVGAGDLSVAQTVQHFISSPTFRAYASDDIIGVEIAGALKNVIAIAAGILDGLEFGSNSRAALITRGLSEITRLGMTLGARMETFAGLAGIGDLVLTCTGTLSRNRYVGFELGKGKSLKEIVSSMKMIAEGVSTTLSSHELALREKVEMPICEQVYQILYKHKKPRSALQDLMSRKLKDEYASLRGCEQ